MVGIAKTGSGKTCGFLLPGLLHIRATQKDPRRGPTVLCIAPTRELAVQIKEEADKFGRTAGIRNTCVYGGAPRGPQMRDLRMGVHIVIATPGRLNDFIENQAASLRQVSYLVLDEADRMLDMGFEPQIQQIVLAVPQQRQTLFFSATWPREVQSIARQFVHNDPVYVFIDHSDDHVVANKSIRQQVDVIDQFSKVDRLRQVLKSKPPGCKVLIFCTTKRACDDLSRALNREFGAAAIHGDKKQPERDYVLRCFKSGSNPILVATDVAARGLDIPNVSVVINFDFPNGVEDYVHRIGRTGRAGNTGESYTFFTREDGKYAHELIDVLRNSEQIIPPQLLELSSQCAPQKGSRWHRPQGGRGGGRGGGGRFGGGFGNRDTSRSWRPQNDRFSGGNRFGNSRFNQTTKAKSRSKSPIRRRSPDYGEYRRDGHETSPRYGADQMQAKQQGQSLIF